MDWADGEDPFKRAATLMPARATMGIADSAWAMHLLGLQEALPGSSYRSLTQSLPMLRAVKDDKELARLAAAGAAADATYTGAPFAATTDGPAYRAMAEAMQEAYGRPMTSLGQGGSIPLCNVFQETYPDAELILMGVEEPLALIHAPNESVDPGEIEAMALTEAIFLERYATLRS